MDKLTTEEISFIINCLNDSYNDAVYKLNNNNDTMGNVQKEIYKYQEEKSLKLIIKLEGILGKL